VVVDAEVNETNQTTLGSARRSVVEKSLTGLTLLEMSGNALIRSQALPSTCGVRLGERPTTIQNLCTRTIEAYHVVPPRRNRHAVRSIAIAAAELNGD
jgi:hypothetical protein